MTTPTLNDFAKFIKSQMGKPGIRDLQRTAAYHARDIFGEDTSMLEVNPYHFGPKLSGANGHLSPKSKEMYCRAFMQAWIIFHKEGLKDVTSLKEGKDIFTPGQYEALKQGWWGEVGVGELFEELMHPSGKVRIEEFFEKDLGMAPSTAQKQRRDITKALREDACRGFDRTKAERRRALAVERAVDAKREKEEAELKARIAEEAKASFEARAEEKAAVEEVYTPPTPPKTQPENPHTFTFPLQGGRVLTFSLPEDGLSVAEARRFALHILSYCPDMTIEDLQALSPAQRV
ncbi:MAG: hypothetical protein OEY01_03455 [Desulfobulbaceae bacterium]|nr:hypothetical protein [Desulfobulbaceae bacterium]